MTLSLWERVLQAHRQSSAHGAPYEMTPAIEHVYRRPSARQLGLAAILPNTHARQATFIEESP
ncbi:hypothetical protein [Ectopseudomonas mendocina]|uniref:Uncharacterized protein n=1 Tax=Ectopseudomonas mendocina TaxID=300 RepID=A0A2R3QNU1_ECTME|nr:hypothetical protein [Pseudomonas mendocina]AVO53420.1 hypothetical protein C7A17_11795 [Pseudomonas mendocina]